MNTNEDVYGKFKYMQNKGTSTRKIHTDINSSLIDNNKHINVHKIAKHCKNLKKLCRTL